MTWCLVCLGLLAGPGHAETATAIPVEPEQRPVTAEEPAAQIPETRREPAQETVNESAATAETIVSLEDVHVTATHPMRGDRDFPGTASVIDTENIERRLMRTIKDIVRYEPNVSVENDPQRFGQSGFNIRGVSGNRVLTLVDGVRVPDSFAIGSFQSAGRNYVDVDSLKAAEIVRGPASALYSSDGIGGVVSFMTKDPADYLDLFGQDNYEALKLMYNSANQSFLQTGTVASRAEGWDGLLLLTHADGAQYGNMGSNDSKSSARTTPNPQDTRLLNLLSKVLYHVDEDNIIRLTGEATENQIFTDVYSLYGTNYTGRNVYQFDTQDRQSRWRVSLDESIRRIGLPWLENLSWRLYGQSSRTRQNVQEGRTLPLGGDQTLDRRFSYDATLVGGQVQAGTNFVFQSTGHAVSYGAEVFHTGIEELRDGQLCATGTIDCTNVVTPDSFPVRDFPLSAMLRASAFVQDRITALDGRLELLPALQYEYYGLDPRMDPIYAKTNQDNPPIAQSFNKVLPKFGTLFHFTDAIALHGQYSEGARAPNFSDANTGFANFAFGYASIPNPELKPETVASGEIGLRLEGTHGFADATLFRNDYHGFIQTAVVCQPTLETPCPPYNLLTYQAINTPGTVQLQGFEFKGETPLGKLWPTLDGLSLIGNYGMTIGQNLETQAYINNVNPMRGVIELRYDDRGGDWGSQVFLSLTGPKLAQYIDYQNAPTAFPTGGYVLLDATAYYRFNDHVTVNAGLFNLLNKKYVEWENARSSSNDPHAGLGPQADIRDRYTSPGINGGVTLRIEF